MSLATEMVVTIGDFDATGTTPNPTPAVVEPTLVFEEMKDPGSDLEEGEIKEMDEKECKMEQESKKRSEAPESTEEPPAKKPKLERQSSIVAEDVEDFKIGLYVAMAGMVQPVMSPEQYREWVKSTRTAIINLSGLTPERVISVADRFEIEAGKLAAEPDV